MAERKLIGELTNSLNSAFNLGLCTSPALERTGEEILNMRRGLSFKKLIAVVGGSYAARLVEQLLSKEAQVVELTQPGWRVSKVNVEFVVAKLTSLMPPPDVVDVQGLDNSSFFCQNEDGSLTLPVKALSDGKFHMSGEMRIASKEQTTNLFKQIKPLLTAVPTAEVVLVTCTPRYMYKPCCLHHGFQDEEAMAKLFAELSTMKRTIRSLLFGEKLSGTKILDPMSICSTKDPASYSDAVHLNTEEYDKLANAVIDCLSRPPSQLAGGGGRRDMPEAKRPRMSGSAGGGGRGSRGWGRGRGGRGGGGSRPYVRRGSW